MAMVPHPNIGSGLGTSRPAEKFPFVTKAGIDIVKAQGSHACLFVILPVSVLGLRSLKRSCRVPLTWTGLSRCCEVANYANSAIADRTRPSCARVNPDIKSAGKGPL